MPPKYTYLTLERFRQIIGINWLDFYGISLASCGYRATGSCAEVWVRDNDQAEDNTLSWSHLLNAIVAAEREVENFLDHPLGLTWVCDKKTWPYQQLNRWYTTPQATFDLGGDFIEAGQRAETLIGTANKGVELVYTDNDGDGFFEVATITFTDATLSGVDLCEIQFRYTANGTTYYLDSPKTLELSGTTLTATFNSFQLLNPSLFSALFTTYPVDICDGTTDNFVDTIDIYRVYNDTTATQAEICSIGDVGNGCAPCTQTDPCAPECQEACIIPIGNGGLVKVRAATPDGNGGFTYLSNCNLQCPPSYVNLYYQINPCNIYHCESSECWRVCPELENAIAALAAARLIKSCVCKCDSGRIKWYQRELGNDNTANTFSSQSVTFNIIESAPFGSLWGEIYAYQLLMGLKTKDVGVVIL